MIATKKQMRRHVEIPSGRHRLSGILRVPPGATGVVAFAHGSGSGRFSRRNQLVAHVLEEGGLATLLLDLLEEDEAEDVVAVFDVELLAERLQSAADWLRQEPLTRAFHLGYLGASSVAAAALVAVARDPDPVGAVVSYGGRPDLASACLERVHAPTLLVVGGEDDLGVDLNDRAFRRLRCCKDMVIIPEATHLFEEPDTLGAVARLARDWFVQHLVLAHSVVGGVDLEWETNYVSQS